jgi:hypothetical protein
MRVILLPILLALDGEAVGGIGVLGYTNASDAVAVFGENEGSAMVRASSRPIPI